MLATLAVLALALSPRYHIARDHGRLWLADAAGREFLSFGVCVVDPGTPFISYDPANPSYAAWRYYASPQGWAEDTLNRLQSWGFNTVGAWSDINDLRTVKTQNTYFTPILHMGSGAGAPWRDMWDPAVVKLMDQIAHDQIVPLRGESRVIGYFSDNEMGWWEGALLDWAWKTAGGRAHLLKVLQSRYPTWNDLLKDFEPVGAASYPDLATKGRLFLRPGGGGMKAVQAYISVLADRYYSLCSSIIKKYDPGALYLGDRYISNFYPEVAAASAGYLDVVSSNLNADGNDGSFTPFYLRTLESRTHKPILISEYYMASSENRSGNKNNSSGFPVVPTQWERARDFSRETNYFLVHPFVVGAHWFQYYDEPKNGRGDGENYDMGLVDTSNRPYEGMTDAAAALKLRSVGFIPRYDFVAFSPAVPGVARMTLATEGGCERGDAYYTRQGANLIIGLYWNEDRFAEAYYRGGKTPLADRPHIRVELGKRSIDVLAGDGGQPVVHGDAQVLLDSTGVRNTLVISIPNAADATLARIHLETRARAYQGQWTIRP